MKLRSAEIVKFDSAVVKINPKHMNSVFARRFVTASVEHIPRTCKKIGLLVIIPSRKTVPGVVAIV
jgi:hypothetical protein